MLRGQLVTPLRRHFSTSFSLLRRFNSIDTLKATITPPSFQDINKDHQGYLSAFKDVFDFAKECTLKETTELESLTRSLIVEPHSLPQSTLKEIILLNPPSPLLIPLLEAYQQRDTKTPISRDVALSALRNCLWDADIQNAVKVVDLTAASPQYLEMMKEKRNNTLIKSFIGLCGLTGGADVLLRLFEMNPRVGVYGMVFAYLGNLAFFGYIAFGGKFVGKVSDIEWQSGVGGNHKLIHADELLMMSKIAESDIHLSNNDGFVSAGLEEELDKRQMKPIHPESDLLLQEYWLSGGDNFEWVEPDQDPALIQWKKHVENKKPNLLKADIKWTDKFIPASEGEPKTT